MMYCFLTYKLTQDNLTKIFAKSSQESNLFVQPKIKTKTSPNFKHTWPMMSLIENNTNENTQIVWSGFQRNTKSIYDLAKKKNIDFFYLDHPYIFHPDYTRDKKNTDILKFNNLLHGKRYFRATKNCFNCTKITDTDDLKYKRLLIQENNHPELLMKDWRKTGNHILVLPPSPTLYEMLGIDHNKLLEDTLITLKKHTDRPIIVRYKKTDKGYTKTNIYDDFNNCWAVVSFGTAGAVKAVMSGIPSFANEYSPACPVSETDFTKIEKPIYPDRSNWLYNLINNQFSFSEVNTENFNIFKYLNLHIK